MTDQDLKLDEALAERLRVVIARLARVLRQQSLDGGLTPSQRSVLATLGRHGPLRLSTIAEIEGIARPSVTGVVGRLERRGFIKRRPDPADGRSAIVEITSAAIDELNRGRQERSAYLAKQLQSFTPGSRERVTDAVELLEGMIPESWTP